PERARGRQPAGYDRQHDLQHHQRQRDRRQPLFRQPGQRSHRLAAQSDPAAAGRDGGSALTVLALSPFAEPGPARTDLVMPPATRLAPTLTKALFVVRIGCSRFFSHARLTRNTDSVATLWP